MEPISTAIIAALTAGLKDTAQEAVSDAYAGLKQLIGQKFGNGAPATKALAKFEEVSDSQRLKDELVAALAEAKADEDADLAAAASKLKEALEATDEGRAVVQKVKGDFNALAANNSTAKVNITVNK